MTKRQSVNGVKSRHENPTPNASRVGPLVMSSVIAGRDPRTQGMPDSLDDQLTNCFAYIRSDIEAAGGSVDDIVKITFWLSDPATQRPALNAEWLRMFPDPASRPARHTLLLPPGNPGKVQADFVAFISST